MLSHNDSCFLYSYTIVRLVEICENLLFVALIWVISSKTRSETNVAIEERRRVFIELMAYEEAIVKAMVIEIFEYMVDEFGKEEV